MAEKVGKILTPADYNMLLTGPCLVRKPNGQPLAIYLPDAMPTELRELGYPILNELRSSTTQNRGMASGTKRVGSTEHGRTDSLPVPSAIIGAFDPSGPQQFCRLTAWTGQETEKFAALQPLFEWVGEQMRTHVADRWQAQMSYVEKTDPAWTIPGTPFTTITVNNTYPTGVHTDKGDLDAGFSTIFCLRRGFYTGGCLTFPEYRVAVDMQDGDLILMDAHEWHGNTQLNCACGGPPRTKAGNPGPCSKCGAERISVVSYYRTKMAACGTPADEAARQRAYAENRFEAARGR